MGVGARGVLVAVVRAQAALVHVGALDVGPARPVRRTEAAGGRRLQRPGHARAARRVRLVIAPAAAERAQAGGARAERRARVTLHLPETTLSAQPSGGVRGCRQLQRQPPELGRLTLVVAVHPLATLRELEPRRVRRQQETFLAEAHRRQGGQSNCVRVLIKTAWQTANRTARSLCFSWVRFKP